MSELAAIQPELTDVPPNVIDDRLRYTDATERGLHGYPHQPPHNAEYRSIAIGGAFPRIGPSALGFLAHTVIAHNLSAQWFYVPAACSYIPPNCIGMCLPLFEGSQVAEARPETPVQYTAGTVTNGALLQLIYTTWQLPYSPGRPTTL